MKECATCGEAKPLVEFRRINKRTGGRHRADCKSCENAARRAYRATTQGKQTRYALNVWDKYGLIPEEYEALVLRSEGRCGICETQLKRFCIDHDHNTNQVRDLLCYRCNLLVGFLETSGQAMVNRAIAYIRKHAALRRSSARR